MNSLPGASGFRAAGRTGRPAGGSQFKTAANQNGGKPYIIMPPKGQELFKSGQTDSIAQVESYGVQVSEPLKAAGGMLANLSRQQVDDLQQKGYRLVPDEVEQMLPPMPWETDPLNLEEASKDAKAEPFVPRPPLEGPRFDAPLLKKFQGEGVTIAVIDTGLYPHPDFNSPDNRVVAFVDFVQGRPIPYDQNGHGTHVAGIAAGSGLMSGGKYQGMAPKANLVGLNVLGAEGSGKSSDIIKAIQWCIDNKDELNIRVINLSLGHKAHKKYEDDPVDQAVKSAYEAGLVVVAAAGNDGPERKTVKAPGDSPFAITVGAVDDRNTSDRSDDTITRFSSRGPTVGGLQKPDVVAPGEGIFAPLAPGTQKEARGQRNMLLHETLQFWAGMPHQVLEKVPPQQFTLMGLSPGTIAKLQESEESAKNEFNRLLRSTSRTPLSDDGAYQALPGTSMATPMVSGLVADMLEANPRLTPDQVKSILRATADPIPGRFGINTQGAGLIDPQEALLKALATPGEAAAPEKAISESLGKSNPGN